MNKFAIAIVDDSPLIRSYLRILLECTDFELVFEAENGDDCMHKIKNLQQLPHLVIMDIHMPVMNGYQTTVALKAIWPSVKILILSAEDSQESVNRSLALGADYFVSKLANVSEEIPQAIQQLFNLYPFDEN